MKLKFLAFLTAMLFLLPLVSSQCQYLSLNTITNQTVLTGQTAAYPITVVNNGPTIQNIRASSVCDPSMTCSFPDLSIPFYLAPNQNTAFHFTVTPNQPGVYIIPIEVRGGDVSASCNVEGTVELNVIQSQPPAASNPINVSIFPSTPQIARPGDTVVYNFIIQNNLNENQYVSISTQSTNPFEATTTYSANDIQLQPGEEKQVTASVTIPVSTPGSTFNWVFTFQASQAAGISTTSIPVTLTVHSQQLNVQLLGMPLAQNCLTASYDNPAFLNLSLSNAGQVTGPFYLTTNAPTGISNIISLSQNLFQINQGEQQPFTISIQPQINTPLNTYFFDLTGSYNNYQFFDQTFCVNIQPLQNLAINTTPITAITGISTTSKFTLTNTGSQIENIELDYNPNPNFGIINLQPTSTQIAPTQTSTFYLTVTPSSSQGNFIYPIYLYAQNYTQEIDFNITSISSSNLFTIQPVGQVIARAGNPSSIQIGVTNNAPKTENVSLSIQGIPPAWYSPTNAILQPAQTLYQSIIFSIPFGAVGSYPITAVVSSPDGNSQLNASLEVLPAPTVQYNITSITSQGSQAVITIQVTNIGNQTITNLQPILLNGGYAYQTNSINLPPGQTTTLNLTLTSPSNQQPEQNVTLQLQSDNGATPTQNVDVPALTGAVTSNLFPWKLALIILLLIGIFVLIIKEKEKQ
jgi:uncharacterized membrane protein